MSLVISCDQLYNKYHFVDKMLHYLTRHTEDELFSLQLIPKYDCFMCIVIRQMTLYQFVVADLSPSLLPSNQGVC